MIKADWRLYRRLFTYLGGKRWLFPLSFLGFALVAGGNMLSAQLFTYLELAFNQPESPWRVWAPLFIIGVALLLGVGSFMGVFVMDYLGRHVIHRLRTDLFNHILRLPKTFYDNSSGGKVISQLVFNVEQVAESTTTGMCTVLRDGLTVLGLLGYLLHGNWKLTLVQIVLLPLIALVVSKASRYLRKYSQRIQSSVADVSKAASEAFAGFQVIRIYNGLAYERARFDAISQKNFGQHLKFRFVNRISGPLINFFSACAFGLVVALVFYTPLQDEFASLGAFMSYITAVGLLVGPLKNLSAVNAVFQKALAAAEQIFFHIDAAPETDAGTITLRTVRGALTFENVSFAYDNQIPVLDDVSLTIPAHQTVAIVGRSGGGKSTLVQLVQRFYDPASGRILLDGVDLRDLSLEHLRMQIAVVSQSIFLFNDSIYNNLVYGLDHEPDRNRLTEALDCAHAHEFINRLPEGWDSVVGDSGVNLSGGQRQRLALARAFLKQAPILILDEATSALDTESETWIQDALERLRKRCTTIVIAHRLSTVEKADCILVLEHGRIVESGAHATLLDRGDVYKKLYERQFPNE